MGNCCRRIDSTEFDGHQIPNNVIKRNKNNINTEEPNSLVSRNFIGNDSEYIVPDISDIFYKNLSYPSKGIFTLYLTHPLNTSSTSNLNSLPNGVGPPNNKGVFRKVYNYPKISDIVLTKDVWRSRIIYTNKLTNVYTIGTNAIGYGICGSVNHCVNKRTQKVYALKSLSTLANSKRKMTSVFNELSIFTQLDHPNIAFMHEAYDDNTLCHIVMEYCSGNELYDRLDTYKRFSESYAIKMTFQMLLTLNYLHSNGICHRDLKLENWVFSNQEIDSLLKMIDFGFARVFEKGIPMGGMHGTVYYVDPEVIDGCYNEKCDIWSTGVIVYMMLSGSPPFNSGSDKEILWKIKKGNLKFEGVRWNSVSELAKEFIRFLLNRNGNERPSAREALQHQWLSNEYNKYSNYTVPKELLHQIVRYSGETPLHRAVIALSVLESDRNCPKEVYRSFFSINTSKSGTISFSEFYNVMSTQLSLSEEDCTIIFRLIGFRNTPELNYTEFVSAVIEYYGTLDITMLSLVFKKLDVYGRGVVDLESFQQVIGPYFGTVNSDEIFMSTDLNRDGVIDFSEVWIPNICSGLFPGV
eukprot:XP_765263.1 calmodulin-domain protein kinase [Theileria parva strain Muguga]